MAFHFTTTNGVLLNVPGGWQFSAPNITLSAWMYWVTSSFGTKMIVGKYPGQGFQRLRWQVDAANHLSFGANWNVQYAIWTSSGTVSANAWHHVLATGSGSDAKLSIDGVIETFTAGGNGPINDSAAVPAGIGGSVDDGQYWAGWLAEVAIWDAGPFTDAQITSLARGAKPPKVSDQSLIGYWPLLGTTLPMADLSGNGRHLTENASDAGQFTDPSTHAPVEMAMV